MDNSCPFENGKVNEKNSTNENNWDKIIPIPVYLKKAKYGLIGYMPMFFFISPYHLVGIGLFASLLLPTIVIGILSFIFVIYPLVKQILRYFNWLPMPHSTEILRTTYSARCDGDFVVFLIGSRPNGPNPFEKSFIDLKSAFQSMIKDLESDSTSGYMGGDLYVGANERKSSVLYVQYWRNYESLQGWTHKKMGVHFKSVTQYMNKDRSAGLYGIWHETYKVRDGEYESIYENMPPIGLALATSAVPETKKNNGQNRMQRRSKEKQAEVTKNTSGTD
ncbi:unnamed protein product [Rotaria magnacalcarata]|uniref:Uncharacterized protein n=1 Tax=Rotaria magnacalcarata TaxID=392030 RepID=A0A819JPU8_9BILA|nr:unnamed protein product [Rotaria magnacalcarata]CAF2242940.1 unnamed protein product [Rotaria magnacalcarata]CAF3896495.1 unnamed protein product [Rotaria magnacalcarata]CAF3936515.1 unnamed protein product [Rotaria magnacalcarata]